MKVIFIRSLCVTVLLLFASHTGAHAMPSNAELNAAGLYDVTKYGADNTGATDSSDAIQAAFNAIYRKDAVIFFPPGTYKVSKTIRALHDRSGAVGKAFHIVGSTAGTTLPTLKLSAGSFNDNNAGNDSTFANGSKQAVIHMWACDFDTKVEQGKTPCTPSYDEQYKTGVNNTNGNTAMFLGHSIENMRIVIESNNPDAIGIRMTGNQRNVLHNVIVEAGSAFAGIYGSVGINSVNHDITVIGGKYGIYNGYGGWSTYTNVTLKDQQILAFTSPYVLPVSLNGFEISKDAAPAVGQVEGINYSQANGLHPGAFTLNDGSISIKNASDKPVITTPSGKQIAVNNVYVQNGGKLIQTEDKSFAGNASGWSRITTFANTMPSVGYKLVEGISSQTDFELANSFVTQGVTPPTVTQLKMRHGLEKDKIPSPDVLLDLSKKPGSGVVNAADHGIEPISFNIAFKTGSFPDYADKFNKLFSDPSIKYIFLPLGRYTINKTITLGKHTHVVGVAHQFSEIRTNNNWNPGKRTDVVATVNDAQATTALINVGVVAEASRTNTYFDTIHWRAGKNSVIFAAFADLWGADGSPVCKNDASKRYGSERSDYHYSGNGGGRTWGSATGGGGCSKYHPKYRGILIDNTQQPLTIYGYNPEDGHGDTLDKREGYQGEIRNAKNVAIIGHKSEESYSLLVRNSSNILLINPSGSVGWALRDNANLLTLNTVAKFEAFSGSVKNMIEEEINGTITKSYKTNQAVSAIKRGTVDLSVWNMEFTPPPPNPWDLNNDGTVNLYDFNYFLKAVLGGSKNWSELNSFVSAFSAAN